jgi:tetratricopeptide (TPR) repeat protein
MAAVPTHPYQHPQCAQADGLALADGQQREALRQAALTLDLAAAASGQTQAALMCHAHKGMAVVLSRLQAYSPAQSHLAQALRWATVMGSIDLCADLNCALAEVSTSATEQAKAYGASADSLRDARERCRDLALEAARLAPQTADPHYEMRVLLRASDVLDRCGDHEEAIELQQQVLLLMGLHQAEDEAAAHTDTDTEQADLPGATLPADLGQSTLPSGLM